MTSTLPPGTRREMAKAPVLARNGLLRLAVEDLRVGDVVRDQAPRTAEVADRTKLADGRWQVGLRLVPLPGEKHPGREFERHVRAGRQFVAEHAMREETRTCRMCSQPTWLRFDAATSQPNTHRVVCDPCRAALDEKVARSVAEATARQPQAGTSPARKPARRRTG